MESCSTQAVLPLVGLTADKVIRNRYNFRGEVGGKGDKARIVGEACESRRGHERGIGRSHGIRITVQEKAGFSGIYSAQLVGLDMVTQELPQFHGNAAVSAAGGGHHSQLPFD
ncbi:MAG: hypothetical protein R6U98_34135 [Pirellulaceae bacterium]